MEGREGKGRKGREGKKKKKSSRRRTKRERRGRISLTRNFSHRKREREREGRKEARTISPLDGEIPRAALRVARMKRGEQGSGRFSRSRRSFPRAGLAPTSPQGRSLHNMTLPSCDSSREAAGGRARMVGWRSLLLPRDY